MSQDTDKQFSIRLPVELVDRLDEYAERTERSRAGAIRFAVERVLAADAVARSHVGDFVELERSAAARAGRRRG